MRPSRANISCVRMSKTVCRGKATHFRHLHLSPKVYDNVVAGLPENSSTKIIPRHTYVRAFDLQSCGQQHSLFLNLLACAVSSLHCFTSTTTIATTNDTISVIVRFRPSAITAWMHLVFPCCEAATRFPFALAVPPVALTALPILWHVYT